MNSEFLFIAVRGGWTGTVGQFLWQLGQVGEVGASVGPGFGFSPAFDSGVTGQLLVPSAPVSIPQCHCDYKAGLAMGVLRISTITHTMAGTQ